MNSMIIIIMADIGIAKRVAFAVKGKHWPLSLGEDSIFLAMKVLN